MGCPVGGVVGCAVGCPVGCPVGAVGIAVGSPVGCPVGCPDGSLVGSEFANFLIDKVSDAKAFELVAFQEVNTISKVARRAIEEALGNMIILGCQNVILMQMMSRLRTSLCYTVN